MDTQTPEMVEINPTFDKPSDKKSRLKTIALWEVGIFETVFVVLGLFLIFGVLNYFNILSISSLFPRQLGFLPHRPYQQVEKTPSSLFSKLPVSKNTTRYPGNTFNKLITLSCPVSAALCNTGKTVTYTSYNNAPSFAYLLPLGTVVKTISPALGSTGFAITNKNEVTKALLQSFVYNNNCYRAAYFFPKDTAIAKITALPTEKGYAIATTGANFLDINGQKANFLLQFNKKPLDKSTAGQPDYQRCPAVNLSPQDLAGGYVPINYDMFGKAPR